MQYLRAEDTIDISATAADIFFTITAPANGQLLVNKMYCRNEETVGSMTSTVGVGSVEVGGTEYATFTTVAAQAVGSTIKAVAATAVGNDGIVPIATGDVITCVLKTEATGGTVTGELRVYLPIEWEDTN